MAPQKLIDACQTTLDDDKGELDLQEHFGAGDLADTFVAILEALDPGDQDKSRHGILIGFRAAFNI